MCRIQFFCIGFASVKMSGTNLGGTLPQNDLEKHVIWRHWQIVGSNVIV